MRSAWLITGALAAVWSGCAVFGSSSGEEEGIRVRVDNRRSEAVVVRIDGKRVGEAQPLGETALRAERVGIERRQVRVCVNPDGAPGEICAPGRLLVPQSVREIWIVVLRSGTCRVSECVRVSVL